MSQQEQQQPREQTPVYRSVKLASPSAMPPPLRSPFYQTKQPAAAAVVLQQDATCNSNNSKPWTLCHPLPTIPAGYMLERNQIRLTTTKPQEVADRISECLQLRSFVLSETSTKNGFRAESTKGLLFRVNFFQDSNNLVIEFQRLNGCSYAFQKTFQAIHRALKQETKQELEFPTCAVPIATPQEKQGRLLETFQIAMDMLASPRIDCQLMGLEVLEPMSTNNEIAQSLLSKHLATVLQFCKGSMEPKSKLEQQEECLLKRRALSILANALETSTAFEHQKIILDTLLVCLQNNNTCGDAHQSFPIARCLVILAKGVSPSELSRALLLLEKEQEKQDLPFLKQEYQKLEALMS